MYYILQKIKTKIVANIVKFIYVQILKFTHNSLYFFSIELSIYSIMKIYLTWLTIHNSTLNSFWDLYNTNFTRLVLLIITVLVKFNVHITNLVASVNNRD